MLLQVRNLHVGYGKKEVLRGVSLDIEEGQIVAIIGPNGAGKSTLLKAIGGILQPWRGEIRFMGEEITHEPVVERVRRGVVYFVQGGEVFPSLTVRENLELGLTGRGRNPMGRWNEVLDLFPDLERWFDRRAGLLSGGQRQQLALVMVLLKEPRLLLLDEPSAGLSPKLVRDVMEKICEVNRRWGIGVLLVEQNVREGVRVSDMVYLLNNGEVVRREDTPDRLLREGELEKIFFN